MTIACTKRSFMITHERRYVESRWMDIVQNIANGEEFIITATGYEFRLSTTELEALGRWCLAAVEERRGVKS